MPVCVIGTIWNDGKQPNQQILLIRNVLDATALGKIKSACYCPSPLSIGFVCIDEAKGLQVSTHEAA